MFTVMLSERGCDVLQEQEAFRMALSCRPLLIQLSNVIFDLVGSSHSADEADKVRLSPLVLAILAHHPTTLHTTTGGV